MPSLHSTTLDGVRSSSACAMPGIIAVSASPPTPRCAAWRRRAAWPPAVSTGAAGRARGSLSIRAEEHSLLRFNEPGSRAGDRAGADCRRRAADAGRKYRRRAGRHETGPSRARHVQLAFDARRRIERQGLCGAYRREGEEDRRRDDGGRCGGSRLRGRQLCGSGNRDCAAGLRQGRENGVCGSRPVGGNGARLGRNPVLRSP